VTHSRDERLALATLLAEKGPDAPTLCTGWKTGDLAAHLVLRESRPDAAAGVMGGPLAGYTARVQQRLASRSSYAQLVEAFRGGPPRFSPFALPRLDEAANTIEYFVHHEDVRRANGQGRRPAMEDVEALCWRASGFLGRRLARHIRPYALELDGQGRGRRKLGQGEGVVLSGPASELALYLSGRRSAAEVTVNGSEPALAALRQAETRL